MRNILKGFLEPKAETYILPNTDDIRMDGEEEFIPLVPEEEEEPEEVLPPGEEPDAPPTEEEPPSEPEHETPVRYAQLQAELILNQAREEVSCSGKVIPCSIAISLHFRKKAILLPRIRMVCIPSTSFLTSSGFVPCTMFQYLEETIGICISAKYLLT